MDDFNDSEQDWFSDVIDDDAIKPGFFAPADSPGGADGAGRTDSRLSDFAALNVPLDDSFYVPSGAGPQEPSNGYANSYATVSATVASMVDDRTSYYDNGSLTTVSAAATVIQDSSAAYYGSGINAPTASLDASFVQPFQDTTTSCNAAAELAAQHPDETMSFEMSAFNSSSYIDCPPSTSTAAQPMLVAHDQPIYSQQQQPQMPDRQQMIHRQVNDTRHQYHQQENDSYSQTSILPQQQSQQPYGHPPTYQIQESSYFPQRQLSGEQQQSHLQQHQTQSQQNFGYTSQAQSQQLYQQAQPNIIQQQTPQMSEQQHLYAPPVSDSYAYAEQQSIASSNAQVYNPTPVLVQPQSLPSGAASQLAQTSSFVNSSQQQTLLPYGQSTQSQPLSTARGSVNRRTTRPTNRRSSKQNLLNNATPPTSAGGGFTLGAVMQKIFANTGDANAAVRFTPERNAEFLKMINELNDLREQQEKSGIQLDDQIHTVEERIISMLSAAEPEKTNAMTASGEAILQMSATNTVIPSPAYSNLAKAANGRGKGRKQRGQLLDHQQIDDGFITLDSPTASVGGYTTMTVSAPEAFKAPQSIIDAPRGDMAMAQSQVNGVIVVPAAELAGRAHSLHPTVLPQSSYMTNGVSRASEPLPMVQPKAPRSRNKTGRQAQTRPLIPPGASPTVVGYGHRQNYATTVHDLQDNCQKVQQNTLKLQNVPLVQTVTIKEMDASLTKLSAQTLQEIISKVNLKAGEDTVIRITLNGESLSLTVHMSMAPQQHPQILAPAMPSPAPSNNYSTARPRLVPATPTPTVPETSSSSANTFFDLDETIARVVDRQTKMSRKTVSSSNIRTLMDTTSVGAALQTNLQPNIRPAGRARKAKGPRINNATMASPLVSAVPVEMGTPMMMMMAPGGVIDANIRPTTVIAAPSQQLIPPLPAKPPLPLLPSPAELGQRIASHRAERAMRLSHEFKRLRESLTIVDCKTPFTNRMNALNRLLPYAFLHEPDLSCDFMQRIDHNLLRQNIELDRRKANLKSRFRQILIKDSAAEYSTRHELSMLLFNDAEYERRALADEKRVLACENSALDPLAKSVDDVSRLGDARKFDFDYHEFDPARYHNISPYVSPIRRSPITYSDYDDSENENYNDGDDIADQPLKSELLEVSSVDDEEEYEWYTTDDDEAEYKEGEVQEKEKIGKISTTFDDEVNVRKQSLVGPLGTIAPYNSSPSSPCQSNETAELIALNAEFDASSKLNAEDFNLTIRLPKSESIEEPSPLQLCQFKAESPVDNSSNVVLDDSSIANQTAHQPEELTREIVETIPTSQPVVRLKIKLGRANVVKAEMTGVSGSQSDGENAAEARRRAKEEKRRRKEEKRQRKMLKRQQKEITDTALHETVPSEEPTTLKTAEWNEHTPCWRASNEQPKNGRMGSSGVKNTEAGFGLKLRIPKRVLKAESSESTSSDVIDTSFSTSQLISGGLNLKISRNGIVRHASFPSTDRPEERIEQLRLNVVAGAVGYDEETRSTKKRRKKRDENVIASESHNSHSTEETERLERKRRKKQKREEKKSTAKPDEMLDASVKKLPSLRIRLTRPMEQESTVRESTKDFCKNVNGQSTKNSIFGDVDREKGTQTPPTSLPNGSDPFFKLFASPTSSTFPTSGGVFPPMMTGRASFPMTATSAFSGDTSASAGVYHPLRFSPCSDDSGDEQLHNRTDQLLTKLKSHV